MALNNNFLTIEPRPIGQRTYYATPRVVAFFQDEPGPLADEINEWIDELALPVDPDNLYTIVQIDYSSAQVANNLVSYSALVRYHHWQPQ